MLVDEKKLILNLELMVLGPLMVEERIASVVRGFDISCLIEGTLPVDPFDGTSLIFYIFIPGSPARLYYMRC